MVREGFRIGGTPGDLFSGAAEDYAMHRYPYVSEVINHLVQIGGLDGTGRLLDCGCGTGQLFTPIAKYFQEIVAIDPDPDMLTFAEKSIRTSELKNIKLKQMRAEEISSELGEFRMIAFGASFHWTDRQRVAELVYDRLIPGGNLISINYPSLYNQQAAWTDPLRRVVEKYLGSTRRAGSGTYVQGEFHEAVLERTRFVGQVRQHHLQMYEIWSIDRIIGWLFSSSFASRKILGQSATAFENDIREALHSFAECGGIERLIEISITEARR